MAGGRENMVVIAGMQKWQGGGRDRHNENKHPVIIIAATVVRSRRFKVCICWAWWATVQFHLLLISLGESTTPGQFCWAAWVFITDNNYLECTEVRYTLCGG